MSFTRFDVIVIPRKLTADERKNWRRKDGTERECVLVYNYEHRREIPAAGERVPITSNGAYGAYKRMERDGDIEIQMPSESLPPMRPTPPRVPKVEEPKVEPPKAQEERPQTPRKKKGED